MSKRQMNAFFPKGQPVGYELVAAIIELCKSNNATSAAVNGSLRLQCSMFLENHTEYSKTCFFHRAMEKVVEACTKACEMQTIEKVKKAGAWTKDDARILESNRRDTKSAQIDVRTLRDKISRLATKLGVDRLAFSREDQEDAIQEATERRRLAKLAALERQRKADILRVANLKTKICEQVEPLVRCGCPLADAWANVTSGMQVESWFRELYGMLDHRYSVSYGWGRQRATPRQPFPAFRFGRQDPEFGKPAEVKGARAASMSCEMKVSMET